MISLDLIYLLLFFLSDYFLLLSGSFADRHFLKRSFFDTTQFWSQFVHSHYILEYHKAEIDAFVFGVVLLTDGRDLADWLGNFTFVILGGIGVVVGLGWAVNVLAWFFLVFWFSLSQLFWAWDVLDVRLSFLLARHFTHSHLRRC